MNLELTNNFVLFSYFIWFKDILGDEKNKFWYIALNNESIKKIIVKIVLY